MKKYLRNMDLWLLVITILYCALGSIMIYSASSILTFLKQDVASNYYFVRQMIILGIGLVLFIVTVRVPTKLYKYLAPLYFFGVFAALGGLYIGGEIANGTKGWYSVGFFNIQPSEFAKSALILYLACTYQRILKKNNSKWWEYFIPFILCGGVALCVLLQPDLGSALIVGGIALGILLALPYKKDTKKKIYTILFSALAIVGLLSIAFKDKIFNDYQLKRFQFLNPCSRYTESTGYQVCNGYIAIHNGGLFGLGFGNSTQKYLYLPEAHTDFIFPIIVEELGLIVGILIILGYGFILYRILLIAKRASNSRNSILAYGTFLYLLLHILINLMGVLALIPLTGVPLPLLSYGGSFTLNAIFMLSICQRVSIETHENQFKEKISNL